MIGLSITGVNIVVHGVSDAAAWATAIGTLALALATVGTALWSRRKERRDKTITDLDETRRLLIVVRHHPEALASAELFGTMVNALAWHSRVLEPDRAADLLARFLNDNMTGLAEIEGLIDRLNQELGRLKALPPSRESN